MRGYVSHEPARLRTPYGLRLPRTALDQGQNRQTGADALLRAHQNHHGLSRLSRLDGAHADADRRKTAAPCRGPTRTMMPVQRYGKLELLGDEVLPSAVVVDSRSLRSAPSAWARGFDGGKLVKGIKLFVVCDKHGSL